MVRLRLKRIPCELQSNRSLPARDCRFLTPYSEDSLMTTLLDKQRSATSNVQSPDEATLDQVLSRIAALAPMVARLAPDIEQGRRLPAELVSALRSARIYGMLVPRRYGGLELDPLSAFRAITALARLDGSVGWNAMIGHIGAADAVPGEPDLVRANLPGRQGSHHCRFRSAGRHGRARSRRMEGYRRMAVCQRVPERRVDRGHLRDDGGRFSHRRLGTDQAR